MYYITLLCLFDSYHSYAQIRMHAYSLINMITHTCHGGEEGMQAACVI